MAVTVLDSSSNEVGGGATSLGSGVFDASGANRGIVAGFWSADDPGPAAPTAIETSASAPLTEFASSALSSFYRYGLWAIRGNASDATETVTFTFASVDAVVIGVVSLNGVLQTSDVLAFTNVQTDSATGTTADASNTHTGVASGDQLVGFGGYDDIAASLAVAETGQVELEQPITVGAAYEQVGFLTHRPGSAGSVIGVDTSAVGTTSFAFVSCIVNEAPAASVSIPVIMNSYRQHNQSNFG